MQRSDLGRTGVAVTVAVLAVGVLVATGTSATANNGDAIKAGQTTTETIETVVQNTNVTVSGCIPDTVSGLLGCGSSGIEGVGSYAGVEATGDTYGVYASGNGAGSVGVRGGGAVTGVLGRSFGAGDGVDGFADNSCCSAVYGLNGGTGNGVAGQADSGTGVLAASTTGTALKVTGKIQFSRSGLATVSAGSKNKTVNNVALTSASFIIATVQDQTNVAVKAVVRNLASNSFKIVLTAAATVNTPVGWFVVN
jgi:hypothetical protein